MKSWCACHLECGPTTAPAQTLLSILFKQAEACVAGISALVSCAVADVRDLKGGVWWTGPKYVSEGITGSSKERASSHMQPCVLQEEDEYY